MAVSGTISPGNSPGTLVITNGDLTWNAGGSYDWEIYDIDDGPGTGWDHIDVTGGTLLFSGLAAETPFNINLLSLSALPDTAGSLTGFNPAANYSWTILTAGSAISGFDPSHFFLNTSGFDPYNSYGGSFSLAANGKQFEPPLHRLRHPHPRTRHLARRRVSSPSPLSSINVVAKPAPSFRAAITG